MSATALVRIDYRDAPPNKEEFRSLERLRQYFISKGERPAWVESFMEQLIKQGRVVDRWGTTYTLLNYEEQT
jgi:hypothetical protein